MSSQYILYRLHQWKHLNQYFGVILNLFNDEVQLFGDWRVALREFVFPTKIENVVEGEFISHSLKEYEEATKRAAEDKVISRLYNGSKLGFIPGILTE